LVIFLVYDVFVLLIGNSLVPREPGTRSQDTESGNITIIRFVEGNESDMLNPLQEYREVLALRVDRGDPTSLVKQQVQEFLRIGKRTCDRYKKIIPAEECYSVATREENQNTLFLIPDVGLPREAEEHGYEAPEGGDQAVEDLSAHEAPQEIIQKQEMKQTQDREAPEGEYHVTEGLKNYGAARQETPDEDDNDILDKEKENLHNARILDSDTVVIHLKKRVEDRHDNSKPAKDWEWTELMPLEVPIGDPGGVVERRLKAIFRDRLLEPYTSHLRKLQFKDCYNAAMADEDHALYLMKPPWIPSDFVVTKVFPSTLTPPKQFAWEEEPSRRRIFKSPQAQERTGLERTTFSFAPPDIPQRPTPPPPQQELVESEAEARSDKIGSLDQPDKDGPRQIPQLSLLLPPELLPPQHRLVEAEAETHRDKIGRGPNLPDLLGKRGQKKQNKVGISTEENKEENEVEIRKKEKRSMRITEIPAQRPPQLNGRPIRQPRRTVNN
jgi:hypothetical protein